ncbi:MAG: hypothetical protein L0271_15865 [Gemmatimonadetes bacterium]|nr:hypothetical protein [Gemmatimonadota bacterium]
MDASIRVALVDLPPLIHELVRDLIDEAGDLEIVERDGADVLVVGTDAADTATLCHGPGMRAPPRVIAISADGRRTTLCELRPVVSQLGELSPDQLAEVIRGRPQSEAPNRPFGNSSPPDQRH